MNAQQPDARWYMVDKDGVATLCTDREDAEQEAKDANMAWPHTAPHRAVQLVEMQQPAPSAARPVTPYTCPKCHALWLHWPAEQTGFGRDTLNCRSAAHCHYCEKGGVEQLQRLERVPAVLSAPQPSPTPQADSQPALPEITDEDRSFLHYNPNTDDIVEWVQHYASAAITADRAMRAQAASVAQGDAWRDLCWQIADALECTPCTADEVLPRVLTVAEDAARWRETLMHIGAANHLGGQHFTLNTLRIADQMFLLRGSVAQHFTKCIDAARAARAPADSVTAPATESYVQPVPDKCDRIVWRGHYYHLPLTPPAQAANSVLGDAAQRKNHAD